METKDVVFGFVREAQYKLQKQNVPDLIHHICLLYYFENDDEWSQPEIGKALILSDNITIKHHEGVSGHGAFLTNIINHGEHRWRFRINKINSSVFNGIIGIFALYPPQQRISYGMIDYKASHSICAATGEYVRFLREPTEYAIGCKSGDEIEMICDINNCSLRYIINGTDFGNMCTINPNIQYKAGVYLYYANDSITLL